MPRRVANNNHTQPDPRNQPTKSRLSTLIVLFKYSLRNESKNKSNSKSNSNNNNIASCIRKP